MTWADIHQGLVFTWTDSLDFSRAEMIGSNRLANSIPRLLTFPVFFKQAYHRDNIMVRSLD
jgi:hypothetical protein